MQKLMSAAAVLFLVAGCTSGGSPQEPGEGADLVRAEDVVFSAETAVMESFPVQLRTTVTATNTGVRSVDLTFPDGCVVQLRAYRDEARTQRAWDQAQHVACATVMVEWTLTAGASRQTSVHTSAATILGDDLPNGTYWLAAVLRPYGSMIEVPAGMVDLAVQR